MTGQDVSEETQDVPTPHLVPTEEKTRDAWKQRLLALGMSARLERTVGWNREREYLERHRLKDEDA